jgi:hypothetical protein
VRGRLRVELRAIVHGAAAVIDALRRCDHDPLACATRLTRRARLRALGRAVCSSKMPAGLAVRAPRNP